MLLMKISILTKLAFIYTLQLQTIETIGTGAIMIEYTIHGINKYIFDFPLQQASGLNSNMYFVSLSSIKR